MTAKKTTSVWGTLSKIDVSKYIEKKGTLSYLSWAWAWGTLKENYPDATFEKHWFEMGDPRYKIPYAMDKNGYAYVMVSVTVNGLVICETFPVLDHRNNSVKTPNSFQINTSLQRCLAKCVAYHGLGHYIYAGEDLPSDYADNKEEPLTDDEEERAAIIEHDGGETKAVAETKARAETKNGQPKTLSQWRESFLDHPENVVSKSDAGVVVANQSSVEGWQTANKAFEVFMPTIQDYPDSDECVNKLKVFWKSNKKTLERMSKEQPEAHEQVMSKFKAAKEAAIAGKMPAFPQ